MRKWRETTRKKIFTQRALVTWKDNHLRNILHSWRSFSRGKVLETRAVECWKHLNLGASFRFWREQANTKKRLANIARIAVKQMQSSVVRAVWRAWRNHQLTKSQSRSFIAHGDKHWKDKMKRKSLSKWRQHSEIQRNARSLITRAFIQRQNGFCRVCFVAWKKFTQKRYLKRSLWHIAITHQHKKMKRMVFDVFRANTVACQKQYFTAIKMATKSQVFLKRTVFNALRCYAQRRKNSRVQTTNFSRMCNRKSVLRSLVHWRICTRNDLLLRKSNRVYSQRCLHFGWDKLRDNKKRRKQIRFEQQCVVQYWIKNALYKAMSQWRQFHEFQPKIRSNMECALSHYRISKLRLCFSSWVDSTANSILEVSKMHRAIEHKALTRYKIVLCVWKEHTEKKRLLKQKYKTIVSLRRQRYLPRVWHAWETTATAIWVEKLQSEIAARHYAGKNVSRCFLFWHSSIQSIPRFKEAN